MTLTEWALRWGVPFAALQDLSDRIGMIAQPPAARDDFGDRSESAISNLVRVEASQKSMRLFRNNVGVLVNEAGTPVRFGLANDSPALNKVVKSADLIGWETVTIGHEHVGHRIARFLSVETKPEGWHYTGTPRELAQQAWANLVLSSGGRAQFVSRENSL